jgi:hypothetical protein
MGLTHGLYCLGCCWILMLLSVRRRRDESSVGRGPRRGGPGEKLSSGPWLGRIGGALLIACGVWLLGDRLDWHETEPDPEKACVCVEEESSRVLMLAAGLAAEARGARSFPRKQITIVVPFSAGGPTDTLARILAERMSRTVGQSVIVENTTGAAGTIGVARVARAAPDGYTIGYRPLEHARRQSGDLPAQPSTILDDFEPLAFIATNPQLVVTPQGLSGQAILKALITTPRPIPRRSPRARPVSARRPTSAASTSRRRPAPRCASFPIAAAGRRCRISWPARST